MKRPNDVDSKIIKFCQFLKDLTVEEQRRAYASIYYELAPIDDLMEEGWPNAVQHEYKI